MTKTAHDLERELRDEIDRRAAELPVLQAALAALSGQKKGRAGKSPTRPRTAA